MLTAVLIRSISRLSTRLHINRCFSGKIEARKIWFMVIPEKAASITRTTLRTTGPEPADSAVNALGTRLRGLTKSGLIRWRLTAKYVDAVAKSGRDSVNKHH